ncbi:MAG: tetraacyldisaccharide 4'-kinase [Methylomonas sp.]|nr:tetraacyldisaccharide 4'-kinase [Methylomonas sp.]PPD22358.1 MAG: tetraacyldisaccharide 4'-kinase [Methylomonas sp.]PPD26861.1 MAG: tetraacyldisaccharide 4'-kinase [Methylomonas sp.]PPD38768.1 MAG: tetraacyldisaccharide 4'-kinase [Methylomonas sp.]PPD40188.1 MAG: tetraacyldisaccharide 4'-kinase [Methylomonas sp.]
MKKTVSRWFEDAWYQEMYVTPWFTPLAMLYVDALRVRRFAYRLGLRKTHKLSAPVIIVGNLTVGGTGKTPLTIAIAEYLLAQGYRPGIIARGYGGSSDDTAPVAVDADADPALVGDEAVVLARRSACPVAVCPDRPAAGRLLIEQHGCNVIVCDDGLQHLALARDIEIVVIDGKRRFGNGYCLPVGPLREPPERLRSVDFVVVNDGELNDGEIAMRCVGDTLVNLVSGERKPLAAMKGTRCRAIAGIGNPGRFFDHLAAAGLDCDTKAFADHHGFTAGDMAFNDGLPLIMTEKDAVKCRAFAQPHHWFLPIDARVDDGFFPSLLNLLKTRTHG